MFLLIVPGALNLVMLLLGVTSFVLFVWMSYRLFIRPALMIKADRDSPPPEEGWAYEILMDDSQRFRSLSVGLLDSDIKLRLQGIREDQLVLKFQKERELEEYEITVQPGANLFYRPPHGKKIEPLKSSEQFESRELIGHPALFRVAASVKNNRPLQYVEFELSTKYVINNLGEEKMKFLLTMSRVFPGVDVNSRSKKGLYMFSRFKVAEDDAQDEA
ncbi:MAG: hypothetical protein NXI24_18640 [bacterium]|nr:hypothetical protein [bacterium]